MRMHDLIASASSKNNTGFGIVSSVRCSSSSNQESKIGKRPSPWTGPKPKTSHAKMSSVESEGQNYDESEGVQHRSGCLHNVVKNFGSGCCLGWRSSRVSTSPSGL